MPGIILGGSMPGGRPGIPGIIPGIMPGTIPGTGAPMPGGSGTPRAKAAGKEGGKGNAEMEYQK